MISLDAIRAYERQTTRDLSRYKDLAPAEVDARLDLLGAQFHSPPYDHQKLCTYLGLVNPTLALFLEMGLGKSKIILDIISTKHKRHPDTKALILVPYLIHLAGWQEQAALHAPQLRTLILSGSSEKRAKALGEQEYDICILNYAGLVALCSHRGKRGKGGRTDGKAPHWLYQEMADWLGQQFSIIVGDESTAFKSPVTKIFGVLRYLSDRIPSRYILSDTPFGTSPYDLWSQLYFVDHGVALADSLGVFQRVYFTSIRNPWGQEEFTFRQPRKELLQSRLHASSVRYRSDECLDLPDQTFTTISVPWGKEAKQYYTQVRADAQELLQNGGGTELEGQFMKLRQLCSGFLITKDDTLTFSDNPKVDAVMSLLDTLGPTEKVVIFHFFVRSGDLLARRLEDAGIGYARIGGATKDKPAQLDRFLNRSDTPVIILNESIGAMGLNLQISRHCIFFECPLSPIVRDQACRRIFGRLSSDGQFQAAFYYDLVVQQSVEEKIYYHVRAGRQLLQEILAGRDSF